MNVPLSVNYDVCQIIFTLTPAVALCIINLSHFDGSLVCQALIKLNDNRACTNFDSVN